MTYVCRESSLGAVVLRRRSERPRRNRRNDSRSDFLKDLRRDIVLSPTPLISATAATLHKVHAGHNVH